MGPLPGAAGSQAEVLVEDAEMDVTYHPGDPDKNSPYIDVLGASLGILADNDTLVLTWRVRDNTQLNDPRPDWNVAGSFGLEKGPGATENAREVVFAYQVDGSDGTFSSTAEARHPNEPVMQVPHSSELFRNESGLIRFEFKRSNVPADARVFGTVFVAHSETRLVGGVSAGPYVNSDSARSDGRWNLDEWTFAASPDEAPQAGPAVPTDETDIAQGADGGSAPGAGLATVFLAAFVGFRGCRRP